jgi:hypothetical protein
MPEDVIARIHKMSRPSRQGLEFLNREGQPFIGPAPAAANNESNAMDNNNNESFNPDHDNNVDQPPPVAPNIAGVYDKAGYNAVDNHDLDPDNPDTYNNLNFDNNKNQEDIYYANILSDMNAEDAPAQAQMINNPVNTGVPIAQEHTPNVQIAGVPIAQDEYDDDPVADIAAEMDEKYGPRTDRYNLWARKLRDYSHLYAIINSVNRSLTCANTISHKPKDFAHAHGVLEHTVMTQHGLKKGLKEFGEAGVEAVLKELQQLHKRKVIEAIPPSSLTKEQKKETLQYLMFLKKKGCGRIKGKD